MVAQVMAKKFFGIVGGVATGRSHSNSKWAICGRHILVHLQRHYGLQRAVGGHDRHQELEQICQAGMDNDQIKTGPGGSWWRQLKWKSSWCHWTLWRTGDSAYKTYQTSFVEYSLNKQRSLFGGLVLVIAEF